MPAKPTSDPTGAVAKLDALKKEQVVQFFRETRGNVTESCAGAEISRTAFYNWLRDDRDFSQAILDARAELNDEMEQALIERGRVDRSDTAIIFYLKNRHPDYKPDPMQVQLQVNTIIGAKKEDYGV